MSSIFTGTGEGVAAGTAAPGPGSGTQNGSTNGDWTTAFAETDRPYVANKGWKGPQDMLKAYRNAESIRGVPVDRLLTLPEKADDVEAWGKVYERVPEALRSQLGRPAKPEDYELPEFKNSGYDIGKDFRSWAHELGFTKAQAKELGLRYDALGNRIMAEMEQRFAEDGKTAEQKLRSEWGARYDEKLQALDRARAQLGWENEDILAMRRAVGSEKVIRLFAAMGEVMGEDRGSPLDASRGEGTMSPEGAEQKIKDMKGDKAFMQRVIDGEPKANRELQEAYAALPGGNRIAGGDPRSTPRIAQR
jgi:hypothetical protein